MSEVTGVNVLVVFYSRYGETETLALAAGVGAVQARANIRLRRLRDMANADTIAADSRWEQNLQRMTMDYIAPRGMDASWADVMILASPLDSVGEMENYLGSLSGMTGKIAAPLFKKVGEETIAVAAAWAGFTVIPFEPAGSDAVAAARQHGKRVAESARALKQT